MNDSRIPINAPNNTIKIITAIAVTNIFVTLFISSLSLDSTCKNLCYN